MLRRYMPHACQPSRAAEDLHGPGNHDRDEAHCTRHTALSAGVLCALHGPRAKLPDFQPPRQPRQGDASEHIARGPSCSMQRQREVGHVLTLAASVCSGVPSHRRPTRRWLVSWLRHALKHRSSQAWTHACTQAACKPSNGCAPRPSCCCLSDASKTLTHSAAVTRPSPSTSSMANRAAVAASASSSLGASPFERR